MDDCGCCSFFWRIVLTDILIWIPATTFFVMWWLSYDVKTAELAYNAYLLLSESKAIVNLGTP